MIKPTSTSYVYLNCKINQLSRLAKSFGLGLLWFYLIFLSINLQASCVVSCRDVNISLGPEGYVIISPVFVLADPACDPNAFQIEVYNASNQLLSDTLDCLVVGEVLDVKVVELSTGNRCWSKVTVKDYLPPVFDCRDTLLYCTQSADPNVIGQPLVVDNCATIQDITLSYSDSFEDLPCYSTFQNDSVTAHIERTWTAVDLEGNMSFCTQHIYFKRATVDDVVFPLNRDGFASPKLNCLDDFTDLSLTGVPTIGGQPIDINGHCELVASHADQVIDQCGTAGKKVLRTWTVIDWCSGDFTLDVQLISVADTTAPIITCPANLTVSTDYYDCTATVTLPTATATDECSSVSIEPQWYFGQGYGPFNNVPTGVYEVVYIATDACGNKDTCRSQVEVQDQWLPVAVCDAQTNISLGSDGIAYVDALSFDDGSYDNCSLDYMEVKRDSGLFGPQVYFDCSDVGKQVAVTLRVYDQEGNFNECDVIAEVKDLWRPAISCPDSIWLTCEDDLTNTAITGEPLISENCSVDTVFYVDQANLNSCGLGEIKRRWWVRDIGGNESWCEQIITIQDTSEFFLVFPEDYLTNYCGSTTVSPDSSGRPIIIGTDCERIGVTYDDQIFPVAGSSCFKIFRTWTVINWCTYVANSGSGIGSWTHTQLIQVQDDQTPDLFCPKDTLIAFYGNDCSQSVLVQLPDAQAFDCDTSVTIINDSPFAFDNGKNASGNYPPGQHEVTFYAADGCGNTTSCQMLISVVDAKPPSPVCESGISISIGLDGYAHVNPYLLIAYLSDNCSDSSNITVTLSRNSFNCDDLGEQIVEVYYTDEAGNQATCQTTIMISDNFDVCPSASISGSLETVKGQKLVGAYVYLEGGATAVHQTGTDGAFSFDELQIGEDYTITPEKDTLHRRGISTFDLILISKHIVGLSRFNSPYQMIAADVNNSGSVSTFDVIELRKMILFINERFPNAPSWRFIPSVYTFSNPSNPFQTTFPESITYNSLSTDVTSAEFVALKMGDINYSAQPWFTQEEEGSTRSQEEYPLEVNYEETQITDSWYLEVKLTQDIELSGLQLSLTGLGEIQTVIPGSNIPDLENSNFVLENGKLKLSWHQAISENISAGETLFKVLVKSKIKPDIQLSNHIHAEIYSNENNELKSQALVLQVPYREDILINEKLVCSPNPMRAQTNLEFHLKNRQSCLLRIVDLNGRVVYQDQRILEEGRHSLTLSKSELGIGAGAYIVQLQRERESDLQSRLIVIN